MAFVPRTNYLLAVMSSKLTSQALLLPGALVFVLLAWQLDFLCDDAFISFRYSRNLAEGHGLRYNLAPDLPVEGYSNFLWVLWISLFERFHIDPGSAARLTSVLCGVLLVVWVPAHARRRLQLDGGGTLATGLFLATLPSTALWATGGLATMPTALCVFGVYERLLGDSKHPRGWSAAAFGATAALLRADGAVWVVMLIAAGALVWHWNGREKTLLRALVRVAGVLLIVILAHVAWRYSYYGDVLPNTARIKVGLSKFRLLRGWDYVMTWMLVMPATLLVMGACLRPPPKGWLGLALPAWVVLAGSLLYSLWVGGDFMPLGRFMFSSLPFLTLLFATFWKRSAARVEGKPLFAAGFAAGCIGLNTLGCFDINLVPQSVRSRFHFRLSSPWQSELSMHAAMKQRTEEWILLGRALEVCTEPRQSMILAGIGAVGYYSRLEMLDRYGLVTPEVLENNEPREDASPGHDIEAPTSFFYHLKPSIGGAFLSGVNAPGSYNLPPGWEDHPMSRMTRIERHSLPQNRGFPPGTELRIVRFVAWP